MDTNAQVQEGLSADPLMQLLDASAMNPQVNDADAVRRSEDNILRWMKYLPEDCISRMISMEWDITT
jgi:hypothetical protein